MTGRAVRYELAMWRSLFRWILRRPAVGGGPFGGEATVMPLLWMFIGPSAAEVPILHLILPWHTARVTSLGLCAYGLLWMVGILASLKVHPHRVGPTGMRIRSGLSYDVIVPWNAVATAPARHGGELRRHLRLVQFGQADAGHGRRTAQGSQRSPHGVLAGGLGVALGGHHGEADTVEPAGEVHEQPRLRRRADRVAHRLEQREALLGRALTRVRAK
jgi:hypothetical protein